MYEECSWEDITSAFVVILFTVLLVMFARSIEEDVEYNCNYVSTECEYSTEEEDFEIIALKQEDTTSVNDSEQSSKHTSAVGGMFLIAGASVDTHESSKSSSEVINKEYIIYWAMDKNGIAQRYKMRIEDVKISFLEDSSIKPYVKKKTNYKHEYKVDSFEETRDEVSSNIESIDYIFYLPKTLLEDIPQELLK